MSELNLLFAQQIAKMFLMLLVGFLAVKSGLLPASAGKGLSQVTVFIIRPCAILYAFQVAFTREKAMGLLLAALAAVLTHGVFILLSWLLGKRLFRLSPVERASMIYSNAGNLLMPLIASTMGQEWLFYTCAYMAALQGFVWVHGKRLICEERRVDWKKAFCNVNILAIALGLLLFFADIRLTGVLGETLSGLAAPLGSASMLTIGISFATLSSLDLGHFSRVLLVAAHRLVLYPAVILGLIMASGVLTWYPGAHQILLITLLAAGAPSGVVVTQIAQIYGQEEDQASLINVFTMLCSILTLPALVWVYEALTGSL